MIEQRGRDDAASIAHLQPYPDRFLDECSQLDNASRGS
jgi:hypothetical protein